MNTIALLFMYASWRAPRRIYERDRRRNAAFVLNGVVIAGIAWREAR